MGAQSEAGATDDGQPTGGVRRWLSVPWPERYRLWEGRATRADRFLVGAFIGIVVLGVVTRPLKPFLLASHPVALELLTGDLMAVGAAAAFARVGEAPLWLVVVAGIVGMAKLDWLMWWAGRQWNVRIVEVFTTRERARQHVQRAAGLSPWILGVAVVGAVLPGIPTPIVYAIAGMAGMRLVTFVLCDVAGAALVTSLVAGLGYSLGHRAVDVVLLIDRYAGQVSLGVIVAMFVVPWLKRRWRARSRGRQEDGGPRGRTRRRAALLRWASARPCRRPRTPRAGCSGQG